MESQESKWFTENQEVVNQCSGKWVAILGNKLIAQGNTIEELQRISTYNKDSKT